MFELKADYVPTGDQPTAIEKLTQNLIAGADHQVLLGVTGSGKNFYVSKRNKKHTKADISFIA